jgi:TonB-linked SusC/RagA family outer membrane protein
MQNSRFASSVLAALLLLAIPGFAEAQEMRTVSGEVVSSDNQSPLPGVQVTVKGTRIGTITDANGRFTLRVPGDATMLVLTNLGYRTREVAIEDDAPMTLSLTPEAIGLEGLVVTALGVQREKRSLGYSVQEITGEDLSTVPEINVINSLQGTVAGVNVTDAGPTGGTSRIVIRGSNSLTGNNQPLIVVDGMPIDNSAPGSGGDQGNAGYGGIDYGNTAADIAPYDIESISVLKGPNAAALYGSRAANGAIVITTKSGRDAESTGLGLTATVSYTAEQPLRLPSYQNEYGQGLFGEFQWVDGAGEGLWDFVDESWGPKLDGRPIDQFTGAGQPWVAHPDNVKDFFRTGQTLNTNVAVSRSTASSNIRLSISNMLLSGMSPGNDMDRTSIALKGGTAVTDRLSADAALNYINSGAESRPGTGYDEDNPMQQFIWFGRQVDMNALRNYTCEGDEVTPCTPGGQYNWNYNYHNNPFWEALVNTNEDQRDRVIGHLASTFQVNDWLSVTGRVGQDWYRDRRKRVIAPFSLDDAGDGSFGEETLYRSELNARIMANVTRALTDQITLDASAGANFRQNDYEGSGVAVARLIVPEVYTIDNAAVAPDPWDYETHQEVRSLLGTLTMNYGGFFNIDLTGRNDWSSTLPSDNNSYFYPSIASALVFTDLMPESNLLSSGKVRAAWSRVGADADPYQLALVYNSLQAWGGTPLFAVPNELPNEGLKPEETTSWEVGADLGFLNERAGFVLTYYESTTENQIMPVQVSRASGFEGRVLNAGAVDNWGWELLLRTTPIRATSRNSFQWDVTVNWSKNESKVVRLFEDVDNLVLGTYWSLDIEARKDQPYGTMYGTPYAREDLNGDGCGDPDGQLLLTASGRVQRDPCRKVLGNYNPDWIGGIQNRFSYGPVDLSILVDGQSGGDIFSVTNMFGQYAGVLESSLEGRENDFCDPGIVNEGVLPDGTQNTQSVCPQSHFGDKYGIHEAFIDDASYVKLREVRLGYELPTSWVGALGFSAGSVSLIGRNLALWSNIDNIDPETAFDASNVQGIEFGQFPTARSLGFSITVRP